ncbi:MAG: DUF835 domain-containing protein [Thermoplasmata archaeon]
MEEEKKRIYAKGYEDGLKDAWASVVRLSTRGHSIHELRMIAKGNLAAIPQKVSEKVSGFDSSKLFPEEVRHGYEMTWRVEEGRSYIVNERKPERSFLIFTELVERGTPGLCVARIHPEELRERYGMEDVRLIWLTRSERRATVLGTLGAEEEFLSPTDLAGLASELIRFIEEGGKVIVLEGLEYLITQNSFNPVLKFLQKINERALVRGVTFLVSIDPNTMGAREYQLLCREIGREI